MTDWRQRRPHLRVIDGMAGSNSGPQPELSPTLSTVIPLRTQVAVVSDKAPRPQSIPSSDRYPGGDAA
jgi:hypothetical protein